MATVRTEINNEKHKIKIIASCGMSPDGKQIRKCRTLPFNSNLSKRALADFIKEQEVIFKKEIEDKIRAEENCPDELKDISFEEFAQFWFKKIKKEKRMKLTSIHRFEQCSDRTYKAIGHIPVKDIAYKHIQAFIYNLGEDGVNVITGGCLSTKSQKLHLNFISDVMKLAIKFGIRDNNPCYGVETIKTESKPREMYSIEEVRTLFDFLENEPLIYRTFFTIALFGGLRRGEILGLSWDDIDFEK